MAVRVDEDQRVQVTNQISIVQRGKKGFWQAEYHFNGHRRTSLKTRNRREAEQRARNLQLKLDRGDVGTAAKDVGYDDGVHTFLSEKRRTLEPSTIIKYEQVLTAFGAFMLLHHVRRLAQLTFNHFATFLAELRAKGSADYSVYCAGMTVLGFFRWLKRYRHIKVNPFDGYLIVKGERPEHPAATIPQFEAILANVSGLALAVLAVATMAGLRGGEVAALRVEDVDLEKGFIDVRVREGWKPKTIAGRRRVPIHSRLLAILKAFRETHNVAAEQITFFLAPASSRYAANTGPLERNWANALFVRMAQRLGYVTGRKNRGLTLYALRRSFKSLALDAGIPGALVDVWFGHSLGLNKHYYRPNDDEARKWITKLPFGEASEEEITRAKGAKP